MMVAQVVDEWLEDMWVVTMEIMSHSDEMKGASTSLCCERQ